MGFQHNWWRPTPIIYMVPNAFMRKQRLGWSLHTPISSSMNLARRESGPMTTPPAPKGSLGWKDGVKTGSQRHTWGLAGPLWVQLPLEMIVWGVEFCCCCCWRSRIFLLVYYSSHLILSLLGNFNGSRRIHEKQIHVQYSAEVLWSGAWIPNSGSAAYYHRQADVETHPPPHPPVS